MKDKYVIHITDVRGHIIKLWVKEDTLCYWVDKFVESIRDIVLVKLSHEYDDGIVKYYDSNLNSLSEEEFNRKAKAYRFRLDFL